MPISARTPSAASNVQQANQNVSMTADYTKPKLQPPWLAIAMLEADVAEVPGRGDNPRIVEYLQSTTIPTELWHDETPWCSAFVNWVFKQVGISGTDRANARSWQKWGQPLMQPRLGCVVILSAPERGPAAGHVGFYVSETPSLISVFGGNQRNQVCVKPYERRRLIGYRWPSEA